MTKRTMYLIKQKQAKGRHVSVVTTAEMLMSHRDVKHMARSVQGVGEQTTSSEYAEAKADRCQKM